MKVCIRVILGAKKYWGYLILSMISIILLTLTQLYAPWVIKELTVLATKGDPELATKALEMGLTLLAAYALQALCSFTRGYSAHYGAYHYIADLRTALYDKLQHLSLNYFNDKQTGQLVSRIMNDAANVELLLAHAIPDLIINVFIFLSVAAILFSINVKLAAASLITTPFLYLINIFYARVVLPKFRLNQKAIGDLNGALQDNLSGVKEIQVFNQQEYEVRKIGMLARRQSNTFLNAMRLGELFHPFISFFSATGTVIIIIYGGNLASTGEVSIADIVGFILYLGLFYQPITRLSDVNEQLHTAIAGCERVFEVMDEKSSIKEKINPTQLTNVKGDIEFRHVTFHYLEGSPILEKFDLKIQSGTTVALVGPTGVGKTTLVSLLNRFYDPVQGSILIDNCDLKDVSLKSLRDNVSMVLQDVYLFTGTVFENIAYSCRNATEEQVIAAAQKAQAHEFIMELEHGYNTYIGERGVKLSGGQKQRLAIARALLRDAPILLLDEATSALDNQTEAAVQQALSILSAGRTTLIIAHRLSTIKNADQIVVLEGTGVAEQGTHETLLKKKGIYARLHAAQDI